MQANIMVYTNLVTILIPVYNVEEYLPQCLDSVLNQTYKNLQIVIIDDGSTDNSWSICLKYAAQDKRINAYHQENQGVAATRNHLLEKVKGDYVLFVDSDDWIEPEMIQTMLSYSIEYGADILECKNVINDAVCDKSDNQVKIWLQEEAIHQFLRHTYFRGSMCIKLVRTRLLHNLKFHRGISYGEDALFCWDLLQKSSKIVLINQHYYHYRMNDKSLSHEAFGSKKLSAFDAWKMISSDTLALWPQYSDIANARFCIEMTILLRDAAHSNYQYDKSIQKLQTIVRKYSSLIKKTKLSSWIMYVYAFVGGRNYMALRMLP